MPPHLRKPLTQHEKIITLMVKNQTKRWWLPVDFQREGLGELFVGYEATARFAELGKKYPEMLESRRKGKYVERRIRYETGKEWYKDLPDNMKSIFNKYYDRTIPTDPVPVPLDF